MAPEPTPETTVRLLEGMERSAPVFVEANFEGFERTAFYFLQVGHLIFFALYCLFIYLKHAGYYDEAQFIQFLKPFCYWFPMFYILWAMKVTTLNFWGDQINEI